MGRAESASSPLGRRPFKTRLLSSLTDHGVVIDILEANSFQDDDTFIYLHHDSQTHYTILTSHDLFGSLVSNEDSEKDVEATSSNDSIYWRLQHEGKGWFMAPRSEPKVEGIHSAADADKGGHEHAKPSWVANANEGDVFVPLG